MILLPASNEDGVYVGVKVVSFVKTPSPSCVHNTVPFVADAPETVTALFEQIEVVPPAVAVGRGLILIV